MKILLYLVLTIIPMSILEFQDLIGKHISEAYIFGGELKMSSKKVNKCKYYVLIDSERDFFGMSYNHVILNTDNQDIIKDITVYFTEVIDSSFYNSFTDIYNKPQSIQIVDTVKTIEKSFKNGEFNQNSEKKNLTTRDGTFEEKPLYMMWEKEKYQIRILLKHDLNKSEICFRVPTKKF